MEKVDFTLPDLYTIFANIVITMTKYYAIKYPSQPKNIKYLSLKILTRHFHKTNPKELRKFLLNNYIMIFNDNL